MTDVVFFLKAAPPKGFTLPGTKLIGLEPSGGQLCGGSDAYCSTAYSNLYASLKDSSGRVLPNLLKKYAPGASRVSFVGFSAAHGFLNPFLNNAADRAATSAVYLMDATFGGGKTGYVKAAQDAAAGRMLLVAATSDKGTTDALNNGDYAWRQFVLKQAGLSLSPASARPPMPVPSEGVQSTGSLWYYRYGDAQLHHWDMGKLLPAILQAHPPGSRGSPVSSGSNVVVPLLLALGAGLGAYYLWRRS